MDLDSHQSPYGLKHGCSRLQGEGKGGGGGSANIADLRDSCNVGQTLALNSRDRLADTHSLPYDPCPRNPMPPAKITLLALTALLTAGGALVLWLRVGTTATPLIFLFALIALTCILRIITLIR